MNPKNRFQTKSDRIVELERKLSDANKQNITLSKAMNDGTGDARVDSGEFTFNDWMEIRRRLLEELATAKSELEQFKQRERELPDHQSKNLSPELRTW